MTETAQTTAWRHQVAGLVLAGGRARRMGGRHKAFVELAGKPLVAHVTGRLRPQVAHLAISANAERERLRAFADVVLPDPVPGFLGPLAGVLAGLEWLRKTHPDIPWLLSVPVDTPFLPHDLAARMWHGAMSEGVEMAVAASAGRIHPVIALWPVNIVDDLRHALTLRDVRKVGQFLADRRLVQVAFDATDTRDPFFNINTAEDLAMALSHKHA